MAGIADVAKAAGVSAGTVSNVLNNRNVTPQRRQAVLDAVERLGYRPAFDRRGRARRRRQAQLRLVKLVVLGDVLRSAIKHPVYFKLFDGIERACDESGLAFQVTALPDPEDVQSLTSRRDEGLLIHQRLAGGVQPEQALEQCAASARIYLDATEADIDVVASDDAMVGRLAAKWLLGRGARRIAILGDHRTRVRVDVATEILQASGCTVDFHVVPTTEELNGGSDLDSIVDIPTLRETIRPWIETSEPIDGLFAFSDEVAARSYPILQQLGAMPQKDVHVISVNNDRVYLDGLEGDVATIDTHTDAMGRAAVGMLLERAARPDDPARFVRVVPTLVD